MMRINRENHRLTWMIMDLNGLNAKRLKISSSLALYFCVKYKSSFFLLIQTKLNWDLIIIKKLSNNSKIILILVNNFARKT
jgi:hypothetical protein